MRKAERLHWVVRYAMSAVSESSSRRIARQFETKRCKGFCILLPDSLCSTLPLGIGSLHGQRKPVMKQRCDDWESHSHSGPLDY